MIAKYLPSKSIPPAFLAGEEAAGRDDFIGLKSAVTTLEALGSSWPLIRHVTAGEIAPPKLTPALSKTEGLIQNMPYFK